LLLFRAKACEHFGWADVDHPRCRHGGPAVLREVTQLTQNNGRQFFACPKNKAEQCNFFQWKTD
jgi:endonuclease VIII-like 3